MAIIQPLLDLPEDLALRIAVGELRLNGGVVRNVATGRIVKHLDDALPAKKTQQAVQAAASRASNMSHTSTVVVVAGSLCVVALAGTAVWVWKRSQAANRVESIGLDSALAEYLAAARDGHIDVVLIQRLITSIDEAATSAEPDVLSLTTEDREALVQAVAHHTRQLAAANQVELPTELDDPPKELDQLGQLRHYLRVQELIFARAA